MKRNHEKAELPIALARTTAWTLALVLAGVVVFPAVVRAQAAAASFDQPVRLAAAIAAAQAGLQPSSRPDRFSVTFSSGVTVAERDSPFTTLVLGGSAQVAITRRLAIEVELGRWAHTIRDEYSNQTTRFNNVLVRVGHTSIRNRLTGWNAGANLLMRIGGSNVRFFGGGGLGLFWQKSEYSSTLTDCVPSTPALCRVFPQVFNTNGPVPGVQFFAGMEARVARRVWVFGALRQEGRAFDEIVGGNRFFRAVGGVRLVAR